MADVLSVAAAETARAAGRHAVNGGREVVREAAILDPDARGWARVTAGKACKFCQMLASRGAVYTQDTVDFQAHDGCHCMPEPVFGDTAPTNVVPDRMSVEGMTDEQAADFIAVRDAMAAKYPDAAATVRHWGTGNDAPSRAALRDLMVRELASVTDPEVARRINGGIAGLDAGDSFDLAFAKAYQEGINGINIRHGDGTSTVIVRPHTDRGVTKVPVGDDWSSVRYTATHEFGHALEYDANNRLGDRTPLKAGMSVENGSATVQDAIMRLGYNANVSKYAGANPVEGFAEMFVAYEAGLPGGSPMATLLNIVRQAESWPKWAERGDTAALRPVEWFTLLEELGANRPLFGTFKQ